jgi:hypothetical protein
MTSAIERWVTKELEDLEPDWNGYGEKAIGEKAIDTLAWVSVVPLSNGGLQLEWHTTQFDIEIEVGPDGSLRAVSSQVVAE